MTRLYPKTLIISFVPCTHETGSGALMSSLFRGWPADRLAQVYSVLTPNPQVCRENWRLSLPARAVPFRVRGFLSWLRNRRRYYQAVKHAVAWAQRFHPDIVYAYPNGRNPTYMRLAMDVTRRLNVPLAIHVMDDWPGRAQVASRQGEEGPDSDCAGLGLWNEFFRHARVHLGISERMQRVYEERYGINFEPFANSIALEDWRPVRTNYGQAAGSPFKIVFVGGASADKELAALQTFRDVLLDLRNEGWNLHWTLYSAEMWRQNIEQSLATDPAITYAGTVTHDVLPRTLAEADLLVLALNFDELSRLYLGLSIQNKVPEYMASGTPILAFGPADNPSIAYARQAQWAEVVDENDAGQLRTALRRLVESPELRAQYGATARRVVKENHDHSRVQERFLSMLNRAVPGRSQTLTQSTDGPKQANPCWLTTEEN